MTVRQRKGFLFDEDEPRFEFLRVHVRIGAGEDTRFAVRERDLGEVVAVGEQSDGEGMAVGLRQLGPSEAESSGHAFESVDDVSFDERIKPDGVAGQFVDDVVGLVKRLAEGLAWMWRGVAWLTSRRTFCLTRSSMVRLCSGWLAGSDGVR